MKESLVWAWVRRKCPDWLAIERVEPAYPPGMCDCFWTDMRDGVSGWLELKTCNILDSKYRRGYIPKLGRAQPHFIRRQVTNNCPAGIILFSDPHIHIWRGRTEREWIDHIISNRAMDHVDKTYLARTITAEDIISVIRSK